MSTIGCLSSTINVFDSLKTGKLPDTSLKIIADLMQCQDNRITINFMDVLKQTNYSDCGFAFATSICNGENPTKLQYDQYLMRGHLTSCIIKGVLEEFPSIRRKPCTLFPRKLCLPIHCICRLIDDGSQMIKCNKCDAWFHTKCLNVEERFIKNEDVPWFCSKCLG